MTYPYLKKSAKPFLSNSSTVFQGITFFFSYKDNPWIFVGVYKCGGASYLHPESEEAGNWSYRRNQFYTSGGEITTIEVGDINKDGYTELFLAMIDETKGQAIIKEFDIFHDKTSVTQPPTSSSSIHYLDSTLFTFPILTSSVFRLMCCEYCKFCCGLLKWFWLFPNVVF